MSTSLFELGCAKLRYSLAEAEGIADALTRTADRERFTLADVDLAAAMRDLARVADALAEIKSRVGQVAAKEVADV